VRAGAAVLPAHGTGVAEPYRCLVDRVEDELRGEALVLGWVERSEGLRHGGGATPRPEVPCRHVTSTRLAQVLVHLV